MFHANLEIDEKAAQHSQPAPHSQTAAATAEHESTAAKECAVDLLAVDPTALLAAVNAWDACLEAATQEEREVHLAILTPAERMQLPRWCDTGSAAKNYADSTVAAPGAADKAIQVACARATADPGTSMGVRTKTGTKQHRNPPS